MNRKIAMAAVAAVMTAVLTGCTEVSPEAQAEQLVTRCEGIDKVFTINDSGYGSALFVIHNHPECS